jgi:hypothetical protein
MDGWKPELFINPYMAEPKDELDEEEKSIDDEIKELMHGTEPEAGVFGEIPEPTDEVVAPSDEDEEEVDLTKSDDEGE